MLGILVSGWRGGEGNGLLQLTEDDTRVAALQRAGKISEYGPETIRRAICSVRPLVLAISMFSQIEIVKLKQGDRFLIV